MYYVFCVCGGLFLFIPTFFSVSVSSFVLQFPFSFLSNPFFLLIPLLFVLWARLTARWFPFETKGANMSLIKYSIYQFAVPLPFYFVVFGLTFYCDFFILYLLIGYFQWVVITAQFVRYSAENPTNKIVVYLIPTLAYIVNIFYGVLCGIIFIGTHGDF